MKTPQTEKLECSVNFKTGDFKAAPAQAQTEPYPYTEEQREAVKRGNAIAKRLARPAPAQAQHSPLPTIHDMIRRTLNCSVEYAESEFKALPKWARELLPTLRTNWSESRNNAQRLADALNDVLCDSRNRDKALDVLEEWEAAQ